ncbi:glycosyltransferase family 4 protein [Sphingomonas sp.]|uniref:glycosyltransferase family 4 protein n=1 Tax=Sphingomonas sp. TaxID=28214 RepID=UPI003B3AE1AB
MTTARTLCLIDTVGSGGGAEQFLASLLPMMRRRGVDVEIAALFDWPDDLQSPFREAGVPLHLLHAPGQSISVDSVRRVYALARSGRFNLFWGHLWMGNLHARLVQLAIRGAASVITLHNQGRGDAPSRLKDKVSVALERHLLAGASMKVAVSHGAAHQWAGRHGWKTIEVAHNGIDLAHIETLSAHTAAPALRRAWDVEEHAFLIVNPARLVPLKRHVDLLAATAILARELPCPVRVICCGDGPDRADLEARTRMLGLEQSVTFTGNLAQQRLFPLMAAADAVALLSLREGFGLAAAEALAMRVPTVLTAVDGFLELVGDSDGAFLVPPAEPRAIADALAAIHADPQASRTVARRGAAHVAACYDIAASAARWDQLLRQAGGDR